MFTELLVSGDSIGLIAGMILLYILPYMVLMFLIDYIHLRGKDNYTVYTYSPALAFLVLTVLHVIWVLSSSSYMDEFMTKIKLMVFLLPTCWIGSEIVRHRKFNKSILELLD